MKRDIQCSQATKPSEYDISNQCNLVEGQVPVRAASENSPLDVNGDVTYKKARLPSPVNAPLGIDVIWLLLIHLCEQYVQNHSDDVTVYRYIQCSQLSKVSECATRNRCDLVAVQVSTRAVCEKSQRDVVVV